MNFVSKIHKFNGYDTTNVFSTPYLKKVHANLINLVSIKITTKITGLQKLPQFKCIFVRHITIFSYNHKSIFSVLKPSIMPIP